MSYSVVEYYAKQEKDRCGYCKSPNTNFNHGMWAHTLTVQDYQALIDRGWRRSGSYCYKPIMHQTCCPMYTIKCEALQFKISKSQKKVLKRMGKFLRNELKKIDMDTNDGDQRDSIDINVGEIPNYSERLMRAEENVSKMDILSVENDINSSLHSMKNSASTLDNKQSLDLNSKFKEEQNPHVPSEKMDVTQSKEIHNSKNPPCKKAKLLRIERKQSKLMAQGKTVEEIQAILVESKQQNHIKTLEELLEEVYSGTDRLQMKMVNVASDEFLDTLDASATLYKKYQITIHGDQPKECGKKAFVNFLVKSPLQQWIPKNGPPQGYGSFHEQYWLDDELIAVGVIDILPLCVSSVYFFYDPAYSHLSLGTFGSLREIYLTRQLNKYASDLKYYYMGFYIHTCPKMIYKAKMKPSKLLCPETYVWRDIDACIPKLDKNKYSRFNENPDAIDEDGVVNIDDVWIVHRKIGMPYSSHKAHGHFEFTDEEEEDVKMYAVLVGMKCAQSMFLYHN